MNRINNHMNTSPGYTQFPAAPDGTHIAAIVAVEEEFGVVRPKFENPAEFETVDLTRIICAFKDSAGALHFVATQPMRNSADDRSALVQFIQGALGSKPWLEDRNWDTQTLVGVPIQITIASQQAQKSRRVYSKITNVAPAMAQFAGAAPSLSEAEAALRSYREAAARPGAIRIVAPPATESRATTRPSVLPVPGTVVPEIHPRGAMMPQTGAAPAAPWPANPKPSTPPGFSGQPLVPAAGGPAALGALPMSPPGVPAAVPTAEPTAGHPGNTPFIPTAENPDLGF
ncbi:MAG TPA: hypothetical protein PK236_11890 [Verrucomicrobiota bacterium]|nr:hypothetical protein [Verrucomicrobiota bacterium]